MVLQKKGDEGELVNLAGKAIEVLYVLRVGVIEQMGETGQVSCSSIIFSLSRGARDM
jgi:hypothetical protein